MIYEFAFDNFRSYKNKAILDFTAKPINEFDATLIHVDNDKLLPVSVIYGPNGGGKSSALMALNSLRNIVLSPVIQLAYMKKKNEQLGEASIAQLQSSLQDRHAETYYKLDDDGKNRPTNYSILFRVKDSKYRYELSCHNEAILTENLYIQKGDEIKPVFERDEDGVYVCDELNGVDLENMNESLPLLSYISMLKNIEIVDMAISFFLQIRIMNFDRPDKDRQILVDQIEHDNTRICNVIQSMGIDISGIEVEYNDDGTVNDIYTRHILENGIEKRLTLSEESSGTRKIISILPVILKGIDQNCLFAIDELDAKLHPLLLRRIIELFTDKRINKGSAQMLFTSHDLTTMSNEVFRRDEIWFSALNSYDESVLYSLVDFRKDGGSKPRNDENYSKQYIEGRYGADPYFRQMNKWR